MSELFDSHFLKKLEQLVISSKLIFTEGSGGNRKSLSKGSSVEFSDYREYATGDDFRRIDWNAYGRFERLFIKLFMEEREATVNIFLDTSRSMDWGIPNKNIASRRLAAALCYISLSNYDKVCMTCLNNRVSKVKDSLRGKNAFKDVLAFLESLTYQGTTDLFTALKEANLKSSKGISIIISDLFSSGSIAELIKFLQYKKQEIYICHMLSPQEISPELHENLRLMDVETGDFRDVTVTPTLIKNYRKVFGKFIADIEEACYKYGAHYLMMDVSIPIDVLVKKVVKVF